MLLKPATHICRTVRIGGLSKAELLQRLVNAGIQINAIGQELFADARFRTHEVPTSIDSIQTTVADLGLTHGGVFAQIVEAGTERGLALCPLELGPHLRLALMDQAEGAQGAAQTQHKAPPGSITLVSPPLSNDEDTLHGFYLRRIEGALWLRGYKSWSGHVWQPEDVLVFVAARNAA